MLKLLSLALLFACSSNSDNEEPQKASMPLPERFKQVEERIEDRFIDDGYVVSWNRGKADKFGNAALMTWLYLASASCDKSRDTLLKNIEHIREDDGILYTYKDDRKIRFDDESAFVFGLFHRWQRCPADRKELEKIFSLHMKHDLDKHEVEDLGFSYAYDLVRYRMGLKSKKPKGTQKKILQFGLDNWVKTWVNKRQGLWRVHLATLWHLTLFKANEPLSSKRLCKDTNGIDMPLTDWYCGRIDPTGWLSEFRYNVWEYRHQRSGSWGSGPDGKEGLETPGVDFMILYSLGS